MIQLIQKPSLTAETLAKMGHRKLTTIAGLSSVGYNKKELPRRWAGQVVRATCACYDKHADKKGASRILAP